MIKKFVADKMKVKLYREKETAAQQAAFECGLKIRQILSEEDEVSVLFGTGRELKPLYKSLAKLQDIEWDKVNAFFMDEAVGKVRSPIACEVLEKLDKIPFASKNLIHGGADQIQRECARYGKQLAAHQPVLVCAAMNTSGGIGLLYPEHAAMEDTNPVAEVRLSDEQKEQYGTQTDRAVTVTFSFLKQARHIFLMAVGEDKRKLVFDAVRKIPAIQAPVSLLRDTGNTTLYGDRDSGEWIMMRKSVLTDEVSQNPEEAMQLAREFHLEGVELRQAWGKPVSDLEDKQKAQLVRLLEQYELKACCIASDIFRCPFEDAEIKVEFETLKKTLETAQQLGAPFIRIFSFVEKSDLSREEDEMIMVLKNAAALARQYNVVLVLENEPSVYATNGKMTSDLIKAVNSPFLRCLWDPCNDLFDPDNETPYPAGYQHVKNHYSHVHLKDVEKTGGEVFAVPLGEGEYEVGAQLKSMLLEGYDGFVSLEMKYPQEEIDHPKTQYEFIRENMVLWQEILMEETEEM